MPYLIFNLLVGVILLFPIIVIHELGHAIVGRLLNFEIMSLSVGRGRRLFGFKIFNVSITVNALPSGGLTYGVARNYRFYKLRFWLFCAGGLAFQTLPVLLLYFWYGPESLLRNVVHPVNMFTSYAPLTVFMYTNAFTFLYQLIPQLSFRTERFIYTDGYHLLTIPFMSSKEVNRRNRLYDEWEAGRLTAAEKFEEAAEIYRGLKEKNPGNFIFSYHLASLDVLEGNLDVAKKAYREQLEELNSSTEHAERDDWRCLIYNNIAWINIVTPSDDFLTEADEYSKIAFDSASDNSYFIGTRGAVLVRLGRLTEGLALLEKAFNSHTDNIPKAMDMLFIGIGQAMIGDHDAALKCVEKARTIHAANYFFEIAEKEIHRMSG